MSRACIYYTDNTLGEPLFSESQKTIAQSGLPIVSVSLKPIDFGKNIVLDIERGYIAYTRQILTALEKSESTYVFFTEHDVLYDKSHFDFIPPGNDIFYYNENCWRWDIKTDTMFRHDRMLSLSCMCCKRELALEFYWKRMMKITEVGYDQFMSREPKLARQWGYEPGTKQRRRGGLTDDDFETWSSEKPNIDVRHGKNFSPPKTKLSDFKHPPKWWKEINIKEIENHEKLLRIKRAYTEQVRGVHG